jgi:hypothetical protein
VTTSEPAADMDIIKGIHSQNQQAMILRKYKDEGAIVKATMALFLYRNSEYEKSPEKKKELLSFIESENKIRKEYLKTIQKSKKAAPSQEDIISFGRLYAEEQRSLALKGDWFQDKNGRWSRK